MSQHDRDSLVEGSEMLIRISAAVGAEKIMSSVIPLNGVVDLPNEEGKEEERREIIDEYVQTLRNNKEFSSNFSKIKYVGHSKVNVRGQDIVRFEIEASSKKSRKKNFS